MGLDVALKDWDAVCRAIERGRQCVMLRKGGIHETEGRFEIEHRAFWLFPTWLHQKLDWVKPADRAGVEARETEPDQVEIRAMARVTDIVRVRSRQQVDAIDDAHLYLPPLIDMRFNYKPQNPLYVLVVRAYVLQTPVTVPMTPIYAGCKSWVPLEKSICDAHVRPVMDDEAFEAVRQDLLRRMQSA
jgi:hypothetical protein